jgi:protein-tyrosine-phosphatase
MADRKRILFICTGNSCRSQMAEAILRHLGGDRFEALSAGSHPAGFVHPLALNALDALGIPANGLVSKGWDEFAETPVDVVITVCDAAASETCPVWRGDAMTAHWSLPDPAYFPGDEEERLRFAIQIAQRILAKITALIELDWTADRGTLTERLAFLGEI